MFFEVIIAIDTWRIIRSDKMSWIFYRKMSAIDLKEGLNEHCRFE